MSLSYAGVPLLYPDPSMEFAGFVDEYLPLSQSHVIGPPANRLMLRNDPLGANKLPNVVGPAYPEKPRLKFNELYWPTGASRWAEGYFLCDANHLGEIISKVGTTPQKLTMAGGAGLSTDMYLLPPRPISGAVGSNIPWILPLVDERYFWQFQHRANGSINDDYSTPWLDLITSLIGSLGVSSPIISTISAKYGVPEPACFGRDYAPAVLIDAACHSVGQRFIRQIDGSCYSMDWVASEAAYLTNSQQQFANVAGDEFSPIFSLWVRPSAVNVLFPIVNGCGWYTESNGLAPPNNGQNKVITTFAGANGASPSNSTEVGDLAATIQADYELSLKYRFDRTFSGVQQWAFSGYDDHALFQFSQKQSGEYRCQTRVMCPPYNFGVEEMYHAFADTPTFPGQDHLLGKLDETLSQGGSATVSVWSGPAGSETDTGLNVTAYDWLMKSGATAIASGKKVFLTRVCGRLYATNAECA